MKGQNKMCLETALYKCETNRKHFWIIYPEKNNMKFIGGLLFIILFRISLKSEQFLNSCALKVLNLSYKMYTMYIIFLVFKY